MQGREGEIAVRNHHRMLKRKAQVKPGFRQDLRPAKARPNINLDSGLELESGLGKTEGVGFSTGS